MKIKIFSIFDSAALIYCRPFFMPEIGQALRSFVDMANDKNEPVGQHPADYTLFHVGEYDDKECSFDSLKPAVNLGNGLNFVRKAGNSGQIPMALPDDFSVEVDEEVNRETA